MRLATVVIGVVTAMTLCAAASAQVVRERATSSVAPTEADFEYVVGMASAIAKGDHDSDLEAMVAALEDLKERAALRQALLEELSRAQADRDGASAVADREEAERRIERLEAAIRTIEADEGSLGDGPAAFRENCIAC